MDKKLSEISKKAKLGKNVKVWPLSRIREGVKIGDNCTIGSNVYIDHDVVIGNNVKVQNNVLIYFKTIIEDDVFVGPAVCLTNDKYPRSVTSDGKLKTGDDWKPGTIHIKKGASIGAGSIILPGVTIGNYALIGAGTVVTKNLPNHALAIGNPAAIKGTVCINGHTVSKKYKSGFLPKCSFCK